MFLRWICTTAYTFLLTIKPKNFIIFLLVRIPLETFEPFHFQSFSPLISFPIFYRVSSDGHINLNFNCAFQTLLVVLVPPAFIFVVPACVRFWILSFLGWCRLFGSFCVCVCLPGCVLHGIAPTITLPFDWLKGR